MSRSLSLFFALAGLFFASFAAAQTPPAAAPTPSAVPPPLTPENTWNLDLSSGGRVVIQLRPDGAPQTVDAYAGGESA